MNILSSQLKKSGQVVTEYVMILTLVVALLAVAKIKISPVTGSIDFSGESGSKTIMELMTDSYTTWMRDILIIISLPS